MEHSQQMEQMEQKDIEIDIDTIILDTFKEFDKATDLYVKEYGTPSITKIMSEKCMEYAIISYRTGKKIIKLINEKIQTEIDKKNFINIMIYKGSIDSINKTLKNIHNAYRWTTLNTGLTDLIEKEFPIQEKEKEEKEEKEDKKSKKSDGIDKEVEISIKEFAKLVDCYKKEKDQSVDPTNPTYFTEKTIELAGLSYKAGKNAILVMEKLIKKKIQEANIYTTLYRNTEQASEILNAVEIHKLTIGCFEKILLELSQVKNTF
jgi:hypothetical protein